MRRVPPRLSELDDSSEPLDANEPKYETEPLALKRAAFADRTEQRERVVIFEGTEP